MAKTVFLPGMRVTSLFLNELNNMQFDGLDADGHRAKIADSELADDGIKLRVNNYLDALKVVATTATSVTVSPGAVLMPDGSLITLATTTLSGLTTGTWFVVVTQQGVVSAVLNPPPVCKVLARIVVAPPAAIVVTDYRVEPVASRPNLSVVFGGTASQNIVVRSTGANEVVGNTRYYVGTSGSPALLRGLIQCRNFTVEAGAFVSVTGGGYLRVEASGDVDIAGNVTCSAGSTGGQGYLGTVQCPGTVLASPGRGQGGATGHNGGSPSTYSMFVSQVGSGGASAFAKARLQGAYTLSSLTDSINITAGNGGDGGGCFRVMAGGAVSLSGVITADGSAGQASTYSTGLDTATQFLLIGGAGGGSGGRVIIQSATSITVSPAVTINCRGGAGGAGFCSSNVTSTYVCRGGGGGGGGLVYMQAPVVSGFSGASANFLVTGGSAGASSGSGGNALSGSTGGSCEGAGGLSNSAGSAGLAYFDTGVPTSF